MVFYYLFIYFILYSFGGWILEVIYNLIRKKQFINRGFLFGPLCPIYGIGALTIIIILNPLKNNIILLLLGSFLFPSFIEYIIGYILEKTFNTTWWDYSKNRYNIKGRICLKFSVIWCIFSLLLLLYIHPYLIEQFVKKISDKYIIIVSFFLCIYLLIDFTMTLIYLFQLKMLFRQLSHVSKEITAKVHVINTLKANLNVQEISHAARSISNKLIYIKIKFNKLIHTKQNVIIKNEAELFYNLNNKIDQLKITYDKLLVTIAKKHSRLFKAYPNLKIKYNNNLILKDIKEKINLRK